MSQVHNKVEEDLLDKVGFPHTVVAGLLEATGLWPEEALREAYKEDRAALAARLDKLSGIVGLPVRRKLFGALSTEETPDLA